MPKDDSTEVEEFEVNDGVEAKPDETTEETENEEAEGGEETSEDESTEESTEESEETEESSEEEDGESKDEPTFEKRYTQLKGETPEEYIKSLEDAYKHSSAEGESLNQRLKAAEATIDRLKADPDIAKKLEEDKDTKAAPVDPTVAYMREEMKKQWASDWESFVDNHPEIDTEPGLKDKLLDELEGLSDLEWRRRQRILPMGEGLSRAWKLLDRDDNKEDVIVKSKETASSSKAAPSAPKKPAAKSSVSEEALKVAARMGLSKEDIEKSYK